MSGIPLAIGPTGKRALNSSRIDRFRSDSASLPVAYRPVADLLELHFSTINPEPLESLTEEGRGRLLDALKKRLRLYEEGVRARMNTGQLTLRTNSFSADRSYHLKELIGELLGSGGVEGAEAWLRGRVAPAPSAAPVSAAPVSASSASATITPLPPLELTPDVANLFRALSFALKGVSGEEEWEALRIRPPPSILGEPIASASASASASATASATASASVPILSPLQRLPYLYWALLLRRDLPVTPATPATPASATSADPHIHPIRTLTNVVALGNRLRSALAPIFYEINMRYGPGNPVFDVISPYIATKSAPIDITLLSDAIGYYARNAPIQDVLQYVIPSDKNWRTYMDRFKGDESIQKRYGKQAAALLVSLLLEKMLTP